MPGELWSVLQTIPIDGSSGKGRQISVPPEFRRATPGFPGLRHSVAQLIPGVSSFVARFCSPLGADPDFRKPPDSRRFQQRLKKTAGAAVLLQSLILSDSPARSLARLIPSRVAHHRATVNRVTRASRLTFRPRRTSARGLFRRRGMPFNTRDASRAAEKASCEGRGGASGSM